MSYPVWAVIIIMILSMEVGNMYGLRHAQRINFTPLLPRDKILHRWLIILNLILTFVLIATFVNK